MGRLEAESARVALLEGANVPRWGTAQEMADLFAYCVSDKADTLTGTDILNDGGVIASIRARRRRRGVDPRRWAFTSAHRFYDQGSSLRPKGAGVAPQRLQTQTLTRCIRSR